MPTAKPQRDRAPSAAPRLMAMTAVNMAARLEGAAAPGSIAISESTWLRASERARFGPPQTVTLKGVGETLVFQSAPVVDQIAVIPAVA